MNYDIRKNSLEECLNYWQSPHDHNKTENYIRPHTEQRTRYLLSLLAKYKVPKNKKILEIGCNCGRNLNGLFIDGYKSLTGVEISTEAVKKQKEFFPELKARIINKPIEDCVLKFKENEFNTIYTMAVLQHIHVDSNWILKEMANIASEYIILIELNLRDYKKIFEKYGYKLIEKRSCYLIKGLEKYFAWILKKK
ncbi:MAG: class I SAM-dependent methyltransferase [Spirochaetes bacterium]|nr:class I SAM-dependent methyltransferase [Spirochaetota bacterium]